MWPAVRVVFRQFLYVRPSAPLLEFTPGEASTGFCLRGYEKEHHQHNSIGGKEENAAENQRLKAHSVLLCPSAEAHGCYEIATGTRK